MVVTREEKRSAWADAKALTKDAKAADNRVTELTQAALSRVNDQTLSHDERKAHRDSFYHGADAEAIRNAKADAADAWKKANAATGRAKAL